MTERTRSLRAAGNNLAEKPSPISEGSKNQDVIREFLWDLTTISVHLNDIRQFWAKALGISGPQWMILMAVADLDRGKGIPVKDVSTLLHVGQPFVTTQSKLLEKAGLVRRIASKDDGRVVLMSLSEKASRQIRDLSSRQALLTKFLFSELESSELKGLADTISSLKKRLEKAGRRLAADT
jgi:MarR family transcriptional regulator, organic hydroperoxide resistance regulator